MLNRSNGLVPATAHGIVTAGDIPHEALVRDVNVTRWWQALLRRRVLFAAGFGGCVLFVAILTFAQPKTYTTAAKLIAGSANADGSRGGRAQCR